MLIFNVATVASLIFSGLYPGDYFQEGPRLIWKVLEYLRLQFESQGPTEKRLCSTRQPPATPDDRRCIIYPDSLTWLGLTRGTGFQTLSQECRAEVLNPRPSVYNSGDLTTRPCSQILCNQILTNGSVSGTWAF